MSVEDNETRRGAAALRVIRRPKLHLEGDFWTERPTRGTIRSVGYSETLYESLETARAGAYV